jgi:hypothetical protein
MPRLSFTRLRHCLLATLATLLLPGFALAQQAPEPPPRSQTPAPAEEVGLVLGVRGVAEVWQDPLLIEELGRPSRFAATAALSYRVWRFVGVDLELGYHRMAGTGTGPVSGKTMAETTTFELVPMTISASAMLRLGSAELFASLGSAVTVFNSYCEVKNISGVKFGPAVNMGVRIDTGMVKPSIRRDAGTQLRALELELLVGRRQHQPFGIGDGLNLSAWRAGVGLMARL